MASRAEVTTRYAKAYVKASKKDKGLILDQVMSVTGWSRDNARRRLAQAAKRPPGMGRSVAARPRKPRSPKYSYDALKVLQRAWAASGGQCGKYLAASMALQLDGLERHDELKFGHDRYSPEVRQELLTMSAASIDRYLKTAKAKDQISGVSTTKPSPLLRNSIKVRRAGDEVETEPGFFEGDTVAHCGPTLKGEFARTLNLTDVHTGWVFTRSIRNNARTHILAALKAAVTEIPYAVTGLDFRQRHRVPQRARHRLGRRRGHLLHPVAPVQEERPGHHRVQEQPPGPQVRVLLPLRHSRGTRCAQSVVDAGQRPAQLPHPDHQTDRVRQQRRRSTPAPLRCPADSAGATAGRWMLSTAQQAGLIAYRDSLNPAKIGRQIADLQNRLLMLAKEKTEQLYLASIPTALPDIRKGIRTDPSEPARFAGIPT